MTGHQGGLFSGRTAFGVGKPELKGGAFPGLGKCHSWGSGCQRRLGPSTVEALPMVPPEAGECPADLTVRRGLLNKLVHNRNRPVVDKPQVRGEWHAQLVRVVLVADAGFYPG